MGQACFPYVHGAARDGIGHLHQYLHYRPYSTAPDTTTRLSQHRAAAAVSERGHEDTHEDVAQEGRTRTTFTSCQPSVMYEAAVSSATGKLASAAS